MCMYQLKCMQKSTVSYTNNYILLNIMRNNFNTDVTEDAIEKDCCCSSW